MPKINKKGKAKPKGLLEFLFSGGKLTKKEKKRFGTADWRVPKMKDI